MNRELQGHYETISTVGETARAFVPSPLPPDPPIEWTHDLRGKFDDAHVAIGQLGAISSVLPDASVFLYTYVRKEAVLSSMIEGTQSSLSDLLLFELDEVPGVPLDDVREVSNYVAALEHGTRRLTEGMPISLRLIREIHAILLREGRGSDGAPGEFRTSQNWIGGSRPGNAVYVPPPPGQVVPCMGDLEHFLHDKPVATPPLLKTALAHVQFETVHPFLDGNGRVGRLLITLLLFAHDMLKQPMLYLSLYFKAHRQYYYELLNRVRHQGDWETWLSFFADAVVYTSKQAVDSATELIDQANRDKSRVETLGRAAPSTQKILDALVKRPVATSGWLVDATSLSLPTVLSGLTRLGELGIVGELTQKKRNRIFSYTDYIDILNRGTELPR
jgi:Fic family protein